MSATALPAAAGTVHWHPGTRCIGSANPIPAAAVERARRLLAPALLAKAETCDQVIAAFARSTNTDPEDWYDVPDLRRHPRFNRWFKPYLLDHLEGARENIGELASGGMVPGFRRITAPEGFVLQGHPGQHWSWVEHAAVAHWGVRDGDHVSWLITARIPLDSVDWVTTLYNNAHFEFSDECEVQVFVDAPVHDILCARDSRD